MTTKKVIHVNHPLVRTDIRLKDAKKEKMKMAQKDLEERIVREKQVEQLRENLKEKGIPLTINMIMTRLDIISKVYRDTYILIRFPKEILDPVKKINKEYVPILGNPHDVYCYTGDIEFVDASIKHILTGGAVRTLKPCIYVIMKFRNEYYKIPYNKYLTALLDTCSNYMRLYIKDTVKNPFQRLFVKERKELSFIAMDGGFAIGCNPIHPITTTSKGVPCFIPYTGEIIIQFIGGTLFHHDVEYHTYFKTEDGLVEFYGI